jgi:hypothetical protein
LEEDLEIEKSHKKHKHEEDIKMDIRKEEPKHVSKKKEEKIDIFNDPLLPEEPERKGRGSEKKKKAKGGSFNGDKEDIDEPEEDINYEDLDENEKY